MDDSDIKEPNVMHQRQSVFKIRFTRQQSGNEKYKLHISLSREERTHHHEHGLIHRISNSRYRIVGDVPSVTRHVKNMDAGMVKLTAQAVNFVVHDAVHTVSDAALASETGVMRLSEKTEHAVRYKVSDKYRQDAVDDYHKGVLFIAGSAFDAARGLRQYHNQNSDHRTERDKYNLLHTEHRKDSALHRKDLKDRYRALKLTRKNYHSRLGEFRKVKHSDGDNILRINLFKERKAKYRIKKSQLKNDINRIETEHKISTKALINQRHISFESSPGLLAVKPIKYYGSKAAQSAWHKAVYEDDNDLMKAADTVKRHGVDKAVKQMNRSARLQNHYRQKDHIANRTNRSENRLRSKEQKLQNKSQNRKKRRKKNSVNRHKSFSERMKSEIMDIFRSSVKIIRNDTVHMIKFLAVILLILLIFMFVLMIFSSFLSGSGFVLGTYTAQDYDLSEAEKYYTSLSWKMNEKILRISDGNWENGLKDFNIDTNDMDSDPDSLVWGNSERLNYDPVYDFDRYKLWSFLCAFYYDFSADADNCDVKYWDFRDSTKDLIEELFNSEYKFEYYYDNTSRWEEYDRYDFQGGIDGSYWIADKNGFYKDCFCLKSNPGELNEFKDNNGYLHFNESLEILNANKKYKRTGWFIQDQRYYVSDRSGQSSAPFYCWFNDCEFGRMYDDYYYHPRTYWGWDDFQIYFTVSPQDTQYWRGDLTESCLVSFYHKNWWRNDCTLYYNVRQLKTFDQVIEDKLRSMSDPDERIEYYRLLSGQDGSELYGNHQTLKSMFSGGSIRIHNLVNGFGWDMQNWNEKHCDIDNLHEGIDVLYAADSEIVSPLNCKVQSYDEDNNTVVLRKNDVRYWYDGNGGKKRDTEITLSNIKINDGIKVGDELKKLQSFARSTDTRKCDCVSNNISDCYVHIKVKVDTDGFGWDYIDPLLVIY